MQQQQLELQLINEQDKATLNLLKCSQNLGQIDKQTWEIKVARSLTKIKRRKDIVSIIRQNSFQRKSKKLYTLEQSDQCIQQKLKQRMKILQRTKAKRRYSTEYQQPLPRFSTKQTQKQNIERIKTIDVDNKIPLQPSYSINQRNRSKTVFIHMLKNKSTHVNFQKIPINQHKSIHNLSSIKVRMLTKKIEESKVMNIDYKELKKRLDQISMIQSRDKVLQETEYRRNRSYLNQILSKRHRVMVLKENLKLDQ